MKILKYSAMSLLLVTALNVQSQALRMVGYAGEVVLTNGDAFTVSGPTLEICEAEFNRVAAEETAASGERLYEGRAGSQKCTQSFIYRSPTAPATSQSSAATLLPELPIPPICLSCLIFDYPGLIKDLYPDHHQLVLSYVKDFKVNQYNQELINLQQQYKHQLAGFEKKMFALEEALSEHLK